MKRICVYCGSSPGRNHLYMAAARSLGGALAGAGIGLVYGGGSHGLMGEVARAVLEGGGDVTGIIPEFLGSKERLLDGVTRLVVTQTMHERKMRMFEQSDGFAALPGGVGTLEELVEITTWAQLGRHAKPIFVYNIARYWDPLLTLIDHMRQEQFIHSGSNFRLEIVEDPGSLIRIFEERAAAPAKVKFIPELS